MVFPSSAVAAALAVLCYAVANVLIEQRLAHVNHVTLIICYTAIMVPIAFAVRASSLAGANDIAFPGGWQLALALAIGLLFFAGDYFLFGAYTHNGDIFTIVTVTMLFPVFASAVRLLFTFELPNLYHIIGYLLAIAAILVLQKGNASL